MKYTDASLWHTEHSTVDNLRPANEALIACSVCCPLKAVSKIVLLNIEPWVIMPRNWVVETGRGENVGKS